MGRTALGLSPSATALAEEVGRASAMVGARSVHDRHEDIPPNTQRVRTSLTSGPVIGIFQLDSDLGACTKVALL